MERSVINSDSFLFPVYILNNPKSIVQAPSGSCSFYYKAQSFMKIFLLPKLTKIQVGLLIPAFSDMMEPLLRLDISEISKYNGSTTSKT